MTRRRLLVPFVLLVSALVLAPRAAMETAPPRPSAAEAAGPVYGPAKGALVIAGGSTLGLPSEIPYKFIELGGGADGKFVIVPTADPVLAAATESQVIGPWLNRGLKNVKMLHTYDPRIADTVDFAKVLSDATAVWFTGGRHWRIVDAYAGTLTYSAFHQVLARGGVIGGNSAGATIQGDYLVRGDSRSNQIVMTDEPNHQKGFEFLRRSAIDQHIDMRSRWDDLIPVIKRFPNLLGIGISEDTAIVVKGDQFDVIGKSQVAIHDNTRKYHPWEKPYYLLGAGDTYNMRTRRVVTYADVRQRPAASMPAGSAGPRNVGGVVQTGRSAASAPPADSSQLTAPFATTVGPPNSAAISAFRNRLRTDVAADNIGGITAAVVIGNRVIWAEGFGWAERGRRAAGVDTIYRIGSISKTITAVALSQLVDRKTIALDDAVETYFPEVRGFTGARPGATPITFRQLASHTAGLIREPTLEGAASGPIAEWESKVLASIPATSFDALPGERYSYSNIGYGVLGLALSRAAGRPFMTLVEDGVFTPLGMTSSTFIVSDTLRPRLSVGYANGPAGIDTELPAREHAGRGYKVPNGGVYSTVQDLARLIGALDGADQAVTSDAMRLEMLTRQTPEMGVGEYGLGLQLFPSSGAATLAGHGGGVAGYTSHIVFDPESTIGVILLRNYESGRTNLAAAASQLVRALIQETRTPSVVNGARHRPSTSAPAGTARPRAPSGSVAQGSHLAATAPPAPLHPGYGSGAAPAQIPIRLPRLLERLLTMADDDDAWWHLEVIDADLDGEIDTLRIHLINGDTIVWEFAGRAGARAPA